MAMKMNYPAFCDFVDLHIAWLRKMPRTLEREYVILCLETVKRREHYDLMPSPGREGAPVPGGGK